MSFFGKIKSAVMGNPVTREYEIGRQVASAGPGLLWKVHQAAKKSTRQVGVSWNTAASLFFHSVAATGDVGVYVQQTDSGFRKAAQETARDDSRDVEKRPKSPYSSETSATADHRPSSGGVKVRRERDRGRERERERVYFSLSMQIKFFVPCFFSLSHSDCLAFATEPVTIGLANILGNYDNLPSPLPLTIKVRNIPI